MTSTGEQEKCLKSPVSTSVFSVVELKHVSIPRRLEVDENNDQLGSSGEVLPENQRHRKNSSNSIGSSLARGTTLLCYRMSDVVVSLLVLLPLTIAMWRGIWNIMDICTDPWLSILIGNTIPITLYYFQDTLKFFIHPRKMNFSLFYLISRILLVTHAFGSINQWRGAWAILDYETGLGSESALISLVLPVGVLILCKVFSNVIASPLFSGVDEATSVHDYPLHFKTPVASKWMYFLDCLWSVLVVQNLVAIAWRGLWNLTNNHLYPSNKTLSACVSLAIGTIIVIILSTLQPCYFRFMMKLKGLIRLAFFDLVTMCGFTGCVLAWRGTWDLYDIYIVFDTKLASEWLTVIVGTFGSVILGCLSTVATRGITIDGEDSGDGTSEWPISYISLLQRKRHHGIPFPEPWLFRYLCTSQRMRMPEPLTLRRRSAVTHTDIHQIQCTKSDSESPIPIKLFKNNIIIFDKSEVGNLHEIRNVDSSSEEESGVHSKMLEIESTRTKNQGLDIENKNTRPVVF